MKKYILCFCVILCACAMLFACGNDAGEEDANAQNQWKEKGKVVSIDIEVLPDKTEFVKGDSLSYKGLKLRALYENGKSAVISEGFSCRCEDFSRVGNHMVEVTYMDRHTSYEIVVASAGLQYDVMEEECVIRGMGSCQDADVVVPSQYEGVPVTIIGGFAFENNTDLRSIRLPEGLICIADSAFTGCTALETVYFPEGFQKMTGGCFRDCTSLKTVQLPKSLEQIGAACFAGCSALEQVVIGKKALTLGAGVFENNPNLKGIYVEASEHLVGWAEDWNRTQASVYWKNDWEYKNGQPTLK